MKQVQIEKIRKAMDDPVKSSDRFVALPGKLDEELVRFISKDKNEPDWMLQKRLKALELFKKTPMPKWGPDLSRLEMDKIVYYRTPEAEPTTDWEDVPSEIKKTFDALGIPEAEQKALAGAGAQFESNVIYHKLKKEFEEQGVIFEDMDVAVQKYPELVKKHFMTNCIPISDHKFIMLHAAVWSGGTFIYIPENVKLKPPLQAYFRMNAKRGGQFEHTLIVAEPNSEVTYIEGCSAPQFGDAKALHAGGVEIYVGEGARVRYNSVENWSTSTYNLNTKRAVVEKNGIIEWVNGNMGCLPGNAEVSTDKGPRKIRDVEKNEVVYAFDTRKRKISKRKTLMKVCTGIKNVFEARVAGRSIRATAEHPFLVLKKSGAIRGRGAFEYHWEPLKNIKEKDLIAVPKIVPAESYSRPESEELSYAEVESIRPAGREKVYDIEVDEAHNFIADGILVHNSCTTMLYPCSILKGAGSRSESLGIAYAGKGQNQDTGAKSYHLAPRTSSTIKSKSISKDGGVCTYRGLVKVAKGAKNSKVAAVCDALILDKESVSNTVPSMDIGEDSVEISHEATVGRLSAEKIFYLMSRGLKEEEAISMIVSGFMEPIMKELPLEYAVELNKLIQLEMIGSVG